MYITACLIPDSIGVDIPKRFAENFDMTARNVSDEAATLLYHDGDLRAVVPKLMTSHEWINL